MVKLSRSRATILGILGTFEAYLRPLTLKELTCLIAASYSTGNAAACSVFTRARAEGIKYIKEKVFINNISCNLT